MSAGLFTFVANGSATGTIARPGGRSTTVPVTVSAGGGDLSPLRYMGDDFTTYTDTTALLAQVSTTIGGTGYYLTCKYDDGYPDTGSQIAIDETVTYNGHHTLRYEFSSAYADTPSLQPSFVRAGATANMADFWYRAKIKFVSGFHSSGPNSGASCGYKMLGWGFAGGNGSGRVELTGAYNETNPEYVLYDSCVHYDNSSWLPTTSPETNCGSITDEWSGTTPWMDYIVHHYTNADGLGTTVKLWRAHDGSTPTLVGTAVTPTTGGQTAPSVYAVAIGLNFNQLPGLASPVYVNYGYWEVVDGSVHANPYSLVDG